MEAHPTTRPADGSPQLSLADRYYAAFNGRHHDAWLDTLDDNVEVVVDAGVLRGRVAALAYLTGILQAYPGVMVTDRRVVAVSSDAVVSEFRLANPAALAAVDPAVADEPMVPWRLDGITCEVLRLRGDRLVSLHSYYSPTPTDRTPTAEVPSRAEAARIAHRQAALGRVASQVAGGGSEQDLITVINQVIAEFAGVDVSLIVRFETDRSAVLLAASGLADETGPVGRPIVLGDDVRAVRDGGRALRFGTHSWPLADQLAGTAAGENLRWCVGVPITLHGSVWGVCLLASARPEPFADDIEDGIVAFTLLVSTAWANAQANDELRERTREQSELLQVAEIAAGGAAAPEVFQAITTSASAVIGGLPTMLTRFVDEESAEVVACHGTAPVAPPGTRVPIDEHGVTALVLKSRRPMRIDDEQRTAGGHPAAPARGEGSVGVPVIVDGRLWGVLSTSSVDGPLPAGTEHRLSLFAGTGAAAIAGAQARADLLALADRQAALRRVAELAAHDAPAKDVLHTVAREASVFAGVEFGMVLRYEGTDGANQIVAVDGAPDNFVVGMRAPGTGDSAVQRVWRTGRAARIEDLGALDGLWPSMASERGLRTSTGVPIIIRGALWGALIVVGGEHGLPAMMETELTRFAELAGTAVLASDARQELVALAQEQAALRRVAELAAHGAPAGEVLDAVTLETSTLAGVDFTTLLRYEPDGSTVMVALHGAPEGITVGMRAPGTGDGAVQQVWRTGRAARIDDLASVAGVWPQLAHTNGFTASVAVPISIHGTLWGVLVTLRRHEAFASAIVGHVSNFAELAAAAVSAADARAELKLLADEQAAVRRVAELVARGATLEEIFDAVAAETSSLLGDLAAGVLRYDEDGAAVVVAGSGGPVAAFESSTDGTVGDSLTVPVTVEGQAWGVLAVRTSGAPLPAGSDARLTPFAELAAVAIVNADTKSKLTASRARVIATADETRRRVQRDVHDGAQQRLVHTIIALTLAREAMRAGEPVADLLDEALTNAQRASKELRNIVRGILPASLTRGGLRSGLESLLEDLALPVVLWVSVPRLSPHIETTAYFVVAEAITNVVKHARATRAAVDITIRGGSLIIQVRDDGIGGADARGGSGLTGLHDRVEAGNGTLTVSSEHGVGTTVVATLPLDVVPPHL